MIPKSTPRNLKNHAPVEAKRYFLQNRDFSKKKEKIVETTSPKPSQNPPKTLPKPFQNPFQTLPKPSQNDHGTRNTLQHRFFYDFLDFWSFFGRVLASQNRAKIAKIHQKTHKNRC